MANSSNVVKESLSQPALFGSPQQFGLSEPQAIAPSKIDSLSQFLKQKSKLIAVQKNAGFVEFDSDLIDAIGSRLGIDVE
jgi:CRISPR/Cas system CMR-associated protein Cmr3 (group 5 of RAMP superfamily)